MARIPYQRTGASRKLASAATLAVAALLMAASAANAAGNVVVQTPSLDFGRAVLGATNQVTRGVELYNATSSTLQLTSMQLTGGLLDFTPSFSNGTTCSTPSAGSSAGVAPGATCAVVVTYSPSTPGPVSGLLDMTFCAAGAAPCVPITTSNVSLAGDGVHAETLTLAPTPLSFISTPLGSPSPAQTVTLTNGPEAMLINGLSFAGAAPSDFVLGNDGCTGSDLAPGASCVFDVRFAPSQAGARAATVTVAGATLGNAYPTLTLTGIGTGSLTSAAPSTPTTGPATTPAATAGTGSGGVTGPADQLELVTCRAVTKAKAHRSAKITLPRCTGRVISRSVTFAANGASAHATISRGAVVYARGSATSRGTRRWQLRIRKLRDLRPGVYTLTLRTARGARRASLTLT